MKPVIHRVQPANPVDHQDLLEYWWHNRQLHQEGNRKVREDQFTGQDRLGRARQYLILDRSG